ncbi:pyridoxamine 5'-phosphate oxidase family protein [Aquamicrobium sp. LC103]|uniref:2Fe-2S iron-sulfur cluster-binding protein n=1 Tax=Aquamicrobium sp. LC103 TaxID=1120658 RepID=UPI00063ECE61|nr:pyridoxamine 5'-phosphate oxidase family protein [Aquamicrobium sp. LC103]TKT81046.1 2Fe-2S iron-sulfur cluster binding domain-containing protein [Aquamicrobium sp. LC103]
MDDRTRAFIEKSTLLFIASRNAQGAMDVSPRGGQPSVLRLREDGALLLPDYVGNKRLDTIGNVLSNPDVALVLLNRLCDDYLRISARASVSRGEDDIAAFPADESRPLSVIVLVPTRMEFVSSKAFDESGFWVDPAGRKPTLDVLDIYARDIQWQTEGGRQPVLYDADAEGRLTEAGLRDFYGTPSPLVQKKVYDTAGPGFMGFIDDARFIVFAHESKSGEILVDLVGGSPLRRDADTNTRSLLLDLEHEGSAISATPHSAEFAILAAEPGRCDNIRLNGTYREVASAPEGRRRLSMQPEEIYFHCSAALTRSRIWMDSRPVAWSGRRGFTCVARRQESPDVVSFVLKPRDRAPIGDAAPGQFVTISLPHDDPKMPRRRCYSISAVPDAHTLRISVRRVGDGGVSALLHDKVAVGDEVFVGPPGGHFVLDSAPLRPIVLVSAGVGITPLLPMAEHLAREEPGRDVWFVHAARNARHHLFGAEARRFAEINPRIRLLTAYSRPEAGDACHHEGRLDAASLARHVPIAEADFYICGPDAFMSSLSQGLIGLGAAPESIRIEAFEQKSVGGFAQAEAFAGRPPCAVTFARSEKQATWKPECGSLLDLALANDIEVQYSCRSGECQSCTQRVVSGGAIYPSGEEPLIARGQILLCQAIPRGDLVLDC